MHGWIIGYTILLAKQQQKKKRKHTQHSRGFAPPGSDSFFLLAAFCYSYCFSMLFLLPTKFPDGCPRLWTSKNQTNKQFRGWMDGWMEARQRPFSVHCCCSNAPAPAGCLSMGARPSVTPIPIPRPSPTPIPFHQNRRQQQLTRRRRRPASQPARPPRPSQPQSQS